MVCNSETEHADCVTRDRKLTSVGSLPELKQILLANVYGSAFRTQLSTVAYPGILFGGGVHQIQLRTEDRENGDLGAVAP